jgi:hypothetical protein
MSSNQHLYFCIDSTCDKMVDYYNAPCCLEHNPLVHGNEETLSHETSECPGCGNDMYCSANGYCSNCWVERFGCDDDTVSLSPISHKCSGEWDYDRGIRICDDEDYHRENCDVMPPLPPSPTSDLEDQLDAIEEKLKTSMTIGQTADWKFLWHLTKYKLRATGCSGCRDDCLNQEAHMHPGGCLYDAYSPEEAD